MCVKLALFVCSVCSVFLENLYVHNWCRWPLLLSANEENYFDNWNKIKILNGINYRLRTQWTWVLWCFRWEKFKRNDIAWYFWYCSDYIGILVIWNVCVTSFNVYNNGTHITILIKIFCCFMFMCIYSPVKK